VVPGLLLQLPAPLQVLGFCCVSPVQLSRIVPQAVPTAGKVQAAVVLSQSVAPQGAVVMVQAAVQQWPVPLIPQTSEAQASFSVQAPVVIWASQAPASVTQKKPLTQSVVAVQLVSQAVPAALQLKLLGQAFVPGLQAPVASQVLPVSWPFAQLLVPQLMPIG
jgi:hypothetical protein